MSCFLGIDAGTSGIKAIVMREDGALLGTGSAECRLITPRPGYAEQNPLEWWKACNDAVAEAVFKSGCGKDIAGIGLSGQMQGCMPVDKDMKPIGNCLIWLDQRAVHEAEELGAGTNVEELLDIAAMTCLPSFWAPKLLWLKRNEPDRFERIYKVLFPKDYLRLCMTGEIATDVSDASCTSLLDMKARTWSNRLIERSGLNRELLPERVLESCEEAGRLLPEVAKRWGVNAGIPVAAGGGDQTVGGIGCRVVREGVISSTIGTSGVVFGCCGAPFTDRQNRAMYSLCHSVPEMYSFLGVTLGAGGSLKWMRDTFFAEKKQELEKIGGNIYSHMDTLAEKAVPGCEGLVFLPYLNGESTPHNDPGARGVFMGLSYRHDLPSIVRSVMEGVTFSLRDTIEIMRDLGVEVNEVRAMGGGAKSALWRQLQADIFNARVITMNMEEGPAAGAAILAGVAAGHFAGVNEGCDAILKPVSAAEPNQKNAAIYDEYYKTYGSLYPTLKNTFASQAALVEKHFE